MAKILVLVKKLFNRKEGATMVEYGLMLSLIAVACLLAVGAVGTAAKGIFNQIAASL